MRRWMIEKREKLGLSVEDMASLCKCSKVLLRMLENGDDITCEGIASRIAYRYSLALDQYNDLVHESRRAEVLPPPQDPPKNSGHYDSFNLPGSKYKS